MRVSRWTILFLGISIPLIGAPLRAQVDPQQLARDVAANELRAHQTFSPWIYTLRKDDGGRKEALRVVNTKDGPLARIISRNGHPLNEEQQRRENQRIQGLLHDHARQQQEAGRFEHDLRRGLDLIRILPDAFLFRVDRQQGQLLQLSFHPNPSFRAGSRAARISHATRGTMLVDPGQKRLVDLKGGITRDVKFGGGILGTISKGGSFEFRQAEARSGQWVVTLIDVNLSGSMLLFETVHKQQHWTFSDIQSVPANLTLAKGAEMLQASQTSALLRSPGSQTTSAPSAGR